MPADWNSRDDNLIVLSRDHQIGLAKEMVLTLARMAHMLKTGKPLRN